ncbi:MAG: hypothetical protein IJX10_07715 [Phascolarctobacterium sp.]|nr:hypothetical protein [Phascolarctobacterium sp.]
MKRKLLLWLLLLLWAVPSLCCGAQSLAEIGKTANGIAYVDEGNVAAIKKDGQIYMLVPLEEHYTNEAFLARLRKSGAGMEQAAMSVYLYMFNNDGTRYCIPTRFVADVEGKLCKDLGKDMVMKPVNNSRVLVKAYEAAYTVLERKQRLMKSMRGE